ncbi:hypothetical protein HBB16_16155 [Pseudonocardia sp. MCCB 268]|nr:hypothetical protein [Pseudonocardia cytotoxica]
MSGWPPPGSARSSTATTSSWPTRRSRPSPPSRAGWFRYAPVDAGGLRRRQRRGGPADGRSRLPVSAPPSPTSPMPGAARSRLLGTGERWQLAVRGRLPRRWPRCRCSGWARRAVAGAGTRSALGTGAMLRMVATTLALMVGVGAGTAAGRRAGSAGRGAPVPGPDAVLLAAGALLAMPAYVLGFAFCPWSTTPVCADRVAVAARPAGLVPGALARPAPSSS